MSIVQISKIQQRSGNLVDLPQLDEAEFGWASDQKRLFIGKTTPNENIEVLTSYSGISFSQIDGSVGNLNINPVDVGLGQVLAFDGTNWVNTGGNAGGNINLGSVSNVTIAGGAIGYVLQTDGLGNLSWTPKTTVTAYIEEVSNTNPIVVTTTQDNYFTNGATITITNAPNIANSIGNALNGGNYYVKTQTSTSFALYTDPELSTPANGIGHTAYSYSNNVTDTTVATNVINIGNSVANANVLFEVNQPVVFLGNLSTSGLTQNITYYINSIPSATTITVSNSLYPNGTAGPVVPLQTTSGLTATVYGSGGRAISSIGGSGGNGAQGSNGTVQFNNNNLLSGNANFTYDFANTVLSVTGGNITTNNFIATNFVSAKYLVSNIATGTAPLIVTSTTRVANLNVDHANVADFANITTTSSGTAYLMLANATSGNVAEYANANLSFNVATGNLSTTNINITGNANVGVNLGVASTITASIVAATNNGNGTNFKVGDDAWIGDVNVLDTIQVSGVESSGANAYIIFGNGDTTSLGRAGTGPLTYGGAFVANGNVTSNGEVIITNNNGHGGSGYAGMITMTNSNVSATNPHKYFRLNSSGNLQIINSGYTTTIFDLSDTGNLSQLTNLTVIGNISAANIIGNGSALSSITGANVTGQVGNALIAGTVYTNAQPNITSVGTLTSLTVTGNISGANLTGNHYGNGSALSSLTGANVSGTVANANNSSYLGGTAAASYLLTTGTGSSLTAITGANVTGTVANANNSSYLGGIAAANYALANTPIGNATNATIVTGAVQNNITTLNGLTTINAGSNTTVLTFTGNLQLSSGSRLQATYADLAEYYEADQDYEPGTVLEFGGDKEVTIAEDGTNRVAGVVSTNPAYVMNATCPGIAVAIALQGRVPVKVRGSIKKGDMLVSGGNGYARPAFNPSMGTVIGKALENHEGIGVIEVAIGRL